MTARNSDDYAPCVVMYPNGSIRKANVLHVRLDKREAAIEKLRHDMAAWVTYEDYDVIKAELHR